MEWALNLKHAFPPFLSPPFHNSVQIKKDTYGQEEISVLRPSGEILPDFNVTLLCIFHHNWFLNMKNFMTCYGAV